MNRSLHQLDRVAIVGSSCSGKTTFARRLAKLLGAPHIELDSHHWGPNWTEIPRDVMEATVSAAVAEPRWVCDGNYSDLRRIVWSRAQMVVWLNYSFPVVLRRATTRTLRRSLTQPILFGENRESFGRAFFSRDSILLWVLQSYGPRRREYRELFVAPPYSHLELIEFTLSRQASRFLREVAREPGNSPPAERIEWAPESS